MASANPDSAGVCVWGGGVARACVCVCVCVVCVLCVCACACVQACGRALCMRQPASA